MHGEAEFIRAEIGPEGVLRLRWRVLNRTRGPLVGTFSFRGSDWVHEMHLEVAVELEPGHSPNSALAANQRMIASDEAVEVTLLVTTPRGRDISVEPTFTWDPGVGDPIIVAPRQRVTWRDGRAAVLPES